MLYKFLHFPPANNNMENFTRKYPEDISIFQIIDANLDRAREGLRVLEDWSRFGLEREDYVTKIKDFRQILGKHHLSIYKNARNYNEDKCRGLGHKEQTKRKKIRNIICSNSARVQEALRVVEEFSRSHNLELSKTASDIRYEIYSLEIDLLNAETQKTLKTLIHENNLYSITNSRENLIEIIEDILLGGVKIIQYRFKDGTDKQALKQANEINQLCKRYNSLFIVNDRIDIALASNADGVHLGKDDLDVTAARKLLGSTKIIGVSANNSSDIRQAIENGCDYLGIGPVFKTSTKKDKEPLGIEKIKDLTKDINIPWFAIGGINRENISYLKDNGINKIAMVSGLLNSEDPKEEAIIILKELNNEN